MLIESLVGIYLIGWLVVYAASARHTRRTWGPSVDWPEEVEHPLWTATKWPVTAALYALLLLVLLYQQLDAALTRAGV